MKRIPNPALDRIRRQAFWRENAGGCAHDHDRARLHLADLVHAMKPVSHTQCLRHIRFPGSLEWDERMTANGN
jgi:hypothetical protein